MNKLTFFFLGGARNERDLKGILLTAKHVAQQLGPQITQVLIKGGAHKSSFKTATGEIKDYPLHYTFHLKTAAHVVERRHYAVHANVRLDPVTQKAQNWYDIVEIKPTLEADGKTLAVMPDEYYDKKRKLIWNKWDVPKNKLKEFSEKDTEGWAIGPLCIAGPIGEAHEDSAKAYNEVKAHQEQLKAATEAA
ncbi:MAG: hypothetical protein Q9190_000117 [Brigantiaea leucoxantha]